MKYAFYSDPAHGWLKVTIEELKQLNILAIITPCSYISDDRNYVFLEADWDAQTFLNAIIAADWFEDMDAIRNCTKQFYSDYPSFIRNLNSFDASEFISKPAPEKSNVYVF